MRSDWLIQVHLGLRVQNAEVHHQQLGLHSLLACQGFLPQKP